MNINKKLQQDLLEELKITANDLSGNLRYLYSIINELDLAIKHRKNKLERTINLCNLEAFSIDSLAKQLIKKFSSN